MVSIKGYKQHDRKKNNNNNENQQHTENEKEKEKITTLPLVKQLKK
jgi:hypothetical protein